MFELIFGKLSKSAKWSEPKCHGATKNCWCPRSSILLKELCLLVQIVAWHINCSTLNLLSDCGTAVWNTGWEDCSNGKGLATISTVSSLKKHDFNSNFELQFYFVFFSKISSLIFERVAANVCIQYCLHRSRMCFQITFNLLGTNVVIRFCCVAFRS